MMLWVVALVGFAVRTNGQGTRPTHPTGPVWATMLFAQFEWGCCFPGRDFAAETLTASGHGTSLRPHGAPCRPARSHNHHISRRLALSSALSPTPVAKIVPLQLSELCPVTYPPTTNPPRSHTPSCRRMPRRIPVQPAWVLGRGRRHARP